MSCLTILERLGFPYQVILPKKVKDSFEDYCIEYDIGQIKEDHADSAYQKIISRGRLTVPLVFQIMYAKHFHCSTTLMKLNYYQIIYTSPKGMQIHIN